MAENRRIFLRCVGGGGDGGSAFSLVTMRQVHGDRIQVVREGDAPFETAEGRAVLEGDGLLTDVPGLMLGVQTADCVPVLLVDVEKRVVGALHAGWRGTLAGIAGRGVRRMEEVYGSRPEDLLAAVGPSIGPCCYLVGEEVREGFGREFRYAGELLRQSDDGAGMFLDLWEANRRQLADAGLRDGAITVVGECTACSRYADGRRRYFSHRAEHGVTGRMMGLIGVVPE